MRRALATVAALLLLVPAGVARADGDPASDVLLTDDVFLPYPPNAPGRALNEALRATVKRAKAAGFGVKVALVAAPGDLGAYPQLNSQPQSYANLLSGELGSAQPPGPQRKGPPLLVVTTGGNQLGDRAGDALAGIVPVPGAGGDALARTAIGAVVALAKANGKPIAAPALPAAAADGTTGGGGVPLPLVFGAPVLLVALAAFALSRRRDPEEDGASGTGPAPGSESDVRS